MCKNGQGAFLVAEKDGKGAFLVTENEQDAFWGGEKRAGCCTLLKMPRGNSTYFISHILKKFFQVLSGHHILFYCFQILNFFPRKR